MKYFILTLTLLVSTLTFGQTWRYVEKVDQFTGEGTARAYVAGQGTGIYDDPYLCVRGGDGNLEVYVADIGYVADTGKDYIIFSFGTPGSNVQKFTVLESTSKDTAFVKGDLDVLLKDLKKYPKVFVKYVGFDGDSSLAVFNLTGSTGALNKVLEFNKK
jgi:hypothetical protein